MRTKLSCMATIVGATALAVATMTILPTPAWAHEDRGIGDHEFVVGFGTEPAYSGFPNSVQMVISHHDGEPVNEIEGKLQAEVTLGETSETYEFEPNFVPGVFGEQGDYRAWFVPSRSGQYTFRVFGTMEGEKVDEEFTSGPDTFSDVVDTSAASFPVQDPSTGELAEKTDRENTRLEAQVATAQDDASSARTVGMIGIIVGAAGLILAGVALTRRRKN
ncbi:MAG: hypothetical protein WEA10_01460 [Actinomycetota bacterium]